ncbi:MAG: hypothetical protein AB1553_00490 [Nitrospirota bacterium]
MRWYEELKIEEIVEQLEKDPRLVYEHAGLHVLMILWEKLPGISIYLSEKRLFDIKRTYVRQKYNPDDPRYSVKALAARLGVSEKFVQTALYEKEDNDKQNQLF